MLLEKVAVPNQRSIQHFLSYITGSFPHIALWNIKSMKLYHDDDDDDDGVDDDDDDVDDDDDDDGQAGDILLGG